MKRRGLIKALSTFPALLLPSWATLSGTKGKVIYEAGIRGLPYYNGEKVKKYLRPGRPLRLKPEPDNPYDAYAIAIYWQDYKLGYVPRDENRVLAGMLGKGFELKAEVLEVDEEEYEWIKIKVMV